MADVVIRLDGVAITTHVNYARTSFVGVADGQVGSASVVLEDPDQVLVASDFRAGMTLELYVDGEREWDGWVFGVRRGYNFDADDTAQGTPRDWTLTGLDRNLLFQKRFLFRQDDPTDPTGLRDWEQGTMDRTALEYAIANYVDLAGDGIDTSGGIKTIATPGPYEDFTLGYVGAQLGTLFEDASKITGGVFFIGPDRVLRYVGDTDVTAPFDLCDTDHGVGYREFEAVLEGTDMANDALVWGAGVGSADPAFGRYRSTDSIATHGLWQWSDQYLGSSLDLTMERRAETYVEGSPSHRRGHGDPVPAVTCVIHEPGVHAGHVVDFHAHTFDYTQHLPVRKVAITFPTPDAVRYELELSLKVDTPYGVPDLWDFGSRNPPPDDPPPPTGGTPDGGTPVLIDHFDDEPELGPYIMGFEQGYTSGLSHSFLMPDGSGYEGGVVGGITRRYVLLFQYTQSTVSGSTGGPTDLLPSPWELIAGGGVSCTHGLIPFNNGHPFDRMRVWRFDVDAWAGEPEQLPPTGATVVVGSPLATEVLWISLLVGGTDNLYVGPSTNDWDQNDWSSGLPVTELGERALYLSLAFNLAWDNAEHGLPLNAEDHNTSIVTGTPADFTPLATAVGGDKTILLDYAYSPVDTGAGLPTRTMTGYSGTGGSQDFITTFLLGLRGDSSATVVVTPGVDVTGADPAIQPGGNVYEFEDHQVVVVEDSHLQLAPAAGPGVFTTPTTTVRSGEWAIIDDPGAAITPVPAAQGELVGDQPTAPWVFVPFDLRFLYSPSNNNYSFIDQRLNLIRFDPSGSESAVILGNPYRAAWLAELALQLDFFNDATQDVFLTFQNAYWGGTGILPEVHADPYVTGGDLTVLDPWHHYWFHIVSNEYPIDPGDQYYLRIQASEPYDEAAGGWYLRVKMWKAGAVEPGWQIEDIMPMYKPGATTYLGHPNIVGLIDSTTDGFEYGSVSWRSYTQGVEEPAVATAETGTFGTSHTHALPDGSNDPDKTLLLFLSGDRTVQNLAASLNALGWTTEAVDGTVPSGVFSRAGDATFAATGATFTITTPSNCNVQTYIVLLETEGAGSVAVAAAVSSTSNPPSLDPSWPTTTPTAWYTLAVAGFATECSFTAQPSGYPQVHASQAYRDHGSGPWESSMVVGRVLSDGNTRNPPPYTTPCASRSYTVAVRLPLPSAQPAGGAEMRIDAWWSMTGGDTPTSVIAVEGEDGLYQTSEPYQAGTLRVFADGIALRAGIDFIEVDPVSGTFRVYGEGDLSASLSTRYRRWETPTVSAGDVYRPAPVQQYGWGSALDGYNCSMAASVMALDRHTLGANSVFSGTPRSTPPMHRSFQSDQSGGASVFDIADAWDNGWNQTFFDPGYLSWATFVARIESGRGAVLSGLYGALPASKRFSAFTQGHALYINERLANGNFWGCDPLFRHPLVYTEEELRTYALSLTGDGTALAGFTGVT
jgi:hypothetical protein